MSVTTDRTSTSGTAAPLPDDDAQRSVLGLTIPQVLGTTLAAATSALAASFLGVAGTLIGAVVGSIVATIGGAVYSHSLGLAAMQLRVVRPGSRAAAEGSTHASQDDGLMSDSDTEPTEPPAALTPKLEPARRRWLRMLAAVALGAVIAIAGITAFELIIGRPVSGSGSSGTTIGQAVSAPRADTSGSVTTPKATVPTSSAPAATSTTATGSATSSPGASSTAPSVPTGLGATNSATGSVGPSR